MTLRPSPRPSTTVTQRHSADKITAYLPEALPKLQADFLLANILAEPLHELLVSLQIWLNRRARSCSGFSKNRQSL